MVIAVLHHVDLYLIRASACHLIVVTYLQIVGPTCKRGNDAAVVILTTVIVLRDLCSRRIIQVTERVGRSERLHRGDATVRRELEHVHVAEGLDVSIGHRTERERRCQSRRVAVIVEDLTRRSRRNPGDARPVRRSAARAAVRIDRGREVAWVSTQLKVQVWIARAAGARRPADLLTTSDSSDARRTGNNTIFLEVRVDRIHAVRVSDLYVIAIPPTALATKIPDVIAAVVHTVEDTLSSGTDDRTDRHHVVRPTVVVIRLADAERATGETGVGLTAGGRVMIHEVPDRHTDVKRATVLHRITCVGTGASQNHEESDDQTNRLFHFLPHLR